MMAVATAEAQDSARFRFAWPDNLAAKVLAQKTIAKQLDEQAPVSETVRSRYTMRAQHHDGRYSVSFGDVELEQTLPVAVPPEQRAQMILMMKAGLPSYAASDKGAFVALENLAQLQETLRRALSPHLPKGPAGAKTRATFDGLTSEPVLTALALANWNWTVGAWTGADQALDIGDEYAAATQAQMPLVNALITMRTKFRLVRKLPCQRQSETYECVEITATTRPDEAEMKSAVNAFIGKLLPENAKKLSRELESLNVETTLLLVTETATLVPHRYKLRKTTLTSGGEPGGPKVIKRIEETEQSFAYVQPSN